MHGDSAIIYGYAWVTNQHYELVSGIPVGFSVSPEIGVLLWDDALLRDTTGYDGCVRFRFRSYGIPGLVEITAAANRSYYVSKLEVIELGFESVVDSIALSLDKGTLWLWPYEEDSVKATLCLYDRFDNLIPFSAFGPYAYLALSANGGCLKQVGCDDADGCACRWWYPNHEFGEFCITVGYRGMYVSAFVFVGRL